MFAPDKMLSTLRIITSVFFLNMEVSCSGISLACCFVFVSLLSKVLHTQVFLANEDSAVPFEHQII